MGSPAARYPYHLWANGEWHTAISGTHFYNSMRSFRVSLNEGARKRGKMIEWDPIDETAIRFRFGIPRFECKHCGASFERRFNAQKFCEMCVPAGDIPARQRMSFYRLSNPEYLALKAVLDDGLCPVCKTWEATAVDHDHSCCGSIKQDGQTCGQCTRGLLCIGCNIMIEKVESERITPIPATAREYLARHALPRGSEPPQ